MKKNLRKLSLSRETLRTLEHIAQGRMVGAAKPTGFCTMTCPMNTDCDYTYSCPELCGPVVQLTDLC